MKCFVALLILALPVVARAQDPVGQSTTIEIAHRTGQLTRSGGVDLGTLSRDGRTFDLRPGVTTRLVIIDQNPLLFAYEASAIQSTPNANYSTLLSFAETLGSALEAMNAAAGVAGRAAARASFVHAAGTGAAVEVEGLTLNDAVVRLRTARTRLSAISTQAKQSLTAPEQVKGHIASWELPALIEGIRGDLRTLDSIVEKCSTGATIQVDGAASPCNPTGAHKEIVSFATLVLLRRADITASLARLQEFNDDVSAINAPKTVVSRVAFDTRNDQKVVLTIRRKDRYIENDEMFAQELQTYTGEFPITFRPYAPAQFSVGAAFVYSFVRSETFKATRQGDALVVSQSSPQYKKAAVAAMLGITPRKWDNPVLGGQIQLGVSPESGNVGYFVGAGIKAAGLFEIGGGAAFQQVERLAEGLTVGQTIASEADLKVEKKFRAGPYLFISVTLPR